MTPKGTIPGKTPGKAPAPGRDPAAPSARYTPPVPDYQAPSPTWVPVLMFSFLGLGMVTIIANYVDLLPGDGPSNIYLLVGLGLITAGFITATRYR
ncbi:MAG: cell division protein CrgA [Acidimicrobiales bacterium]